MIAPIYRVYTKRVTRRIQWLKTWVILSIMREYRQNYANNAVPLVHDFTPLIATDASGRQRQIRRAPQSYRTQLPQAVTGNRNT